MKILTNCIILCLFFTQALCTTISREHAHKAAVKYLNFNSNSNTFSNKNYTINTRSHNGIDLIHIINFAGGGFALVAANDIMLPILAHSLSNNFSTDQNLPPAVEDLLLYYENAIYFRIIHKLPYHNSSEAWERLMNSDLIKVGKSVSPLIQSEWGQNKSNDKFDSLANCEAYNYYVPETNNSCDCNEKCPTGCVAVAISQIMNYWAHPVTWDAPFQEAKFFNWCEMPNQLIFAAGENPNYELQRNAISELMVHAGQLSHMYYCGFFNNKCESSSSVYYAKGTFKNYEYSDDIEIEVRSDYGDITWQSMLIHELNNGRPVFYRGKRDDSKGTVGHAFICEGYYQTSLGYYKFYFNFGWNGSSDGAYLLDNINPKPTPYIHNQKMLINVYPKEGPEFDCNTQITVRQSFLYNPNSMALYFNPTRGHIYTSEVDPVDIPSAYSVEYSAYKGVHLKNFRVRPGAQFNAHITPCPADCGDVVRFAKIGKNPISKKTDNSYSEESLKNIIDIYPNPANTHINIEIPDISGSGTVCRLYNTHGVLVDETGSAEPHIRIAVYHLPEGLYILQIIGEDINMSRKIVLKK